MAWWLAYRRTLKQRRRKRRLLLLKPAYHVASFFRIAPLLDARAGGIAPRGSDITSTCAANKASSLLDAGAATPWHLARRQHQA
jgi:hypothetical protein